MKVTLNDKAARRPAPATGQIDVWDTLVPGFGLRVSAGGTRTYFAMARIKGKLVRRTIGKHPAPHLTRDDELGPDECWPDQARKKAQLVLADLARGVDHAPAPRARPERPAKAVATAEPVSTAPAPKTFGAVAASYFKDPSRRGGAKLASRGELERKVRVDLAAWRDKPIAEITKAQIKALIAEKREDAPVAANRLLSLVKRIFAWATVEDYIEANVAGYIDATDEDERDRVLTLDELRRVWLGAEALGYPYGPLVKMLMLTAQRRSEVSDLPWSEIDGTSWRLPDARSKRRKGHLIPLSPRAVALLKDLPRIGNPPSPLVFTTGLRAAKKGQKVDKEAPPAPVSGWATFKKRLDRIIAEQAAQQEKVEQPEDCHFLPHWTLHDIRRSVATHLRDEQVMGVHRVDRLTVSRLLNHAEGGMTRIYDRYSSDPEKRAALEAWALVIERLCGLNVIKPDFNKQDAG